MSVVSFGGNGDAREEMEMQGSCVLCRFLVMAYHNYKTAKKSNHMYLACTYNYTYILTGRSGTHMNL